MVPNPVRSWEALGSARTPKEMCLSIAQGPPGLTSVCGQLWVPTRHWAGLSWRQGWLRLQGTSVLFPSDGVHGCLSWSAPGVVRP